MIKELNYDITKNDLKNVQKDYLSVKRLKKERIKKTVKTFIFIFIILLIPFIFCDVLIISQNQYGIAVNVITLISNIIFLFTNIIIVFLFTLIISLIVYFLKSLELKSMVPELYKGTDFQNNKIIIDSEKGTFSTFDRDNNSAVNWSMIKDIYNLKYSILIFISDYRAFIIPKRIFETEQEMNETWKLIKECYDKSRGNIND